MQEPGESDFPDSLIQNPMQPQPPSTPAAPVSEEPPDGFFGAGNNRPAVPAPANPAAINAASTVNSNASTKPVPKPAKKPRSSTDSAASILNPSGF